MSTLIVYKNRIKNEYLFTPGENLLELLRKHGYAVSAPCGGHGLCGKCSVTLNGTAVLACQTVVQEDCVVRIPDRNADLFWNSTVSSAAVASRRSGFGASVDLGSTTVAMQLYDLSDGRCLGSISRWNAQESYGADVITRIGYCIENEYGLHTLSKMIRQQLWDMLSELCRNAGISPQEVQEMTLAGNTVMQHLFAALPPDSIARAPFTPLSLFRDGKAYHLGHIPVYLSPCVAGYVGGDITAGLLSCGLHRRSGRHLFIDVGTNGEMALGGKDGFVTCAVASGPAFEGAGIRCGMPAAFGAVNRVSLTEDGLCYEVLGGGEAVGLCGSGLLDLVACLLELGYIDESGCLETDEGSDTFYLTDRVYLTQQDIRQLQLAKAAVAAGIRLLLDTEGLGYDDIDSLSLAGGFGNQLRMESAVRIGMLPSQLAQRTVTVGNASLSGAQQALLNPDARAALLAAARQCRYVELSSHSAFNTCFVEEMTFPEEII